MTITMTIAMTITMTTTIVTVIVISIVIAIDIVDIVGVDAMIAVIDHINACIALSLPLFLSPFLPPFLFLCKVLEVFLLKVLGPTVKVNVYVYDIQVCMYVNISTHICACVCMYVWYICISND
jgi:hypothetical protein